MDYPHPEISTESLLRHGPFVTAVVRGLLSDEARVQDILQETWLTALDRPPRAGVSLRRWLARVAGNLARDSHRNTARRLAREREAARLEVVEPVDVTYERLAGQREVVDAVLALKEPYRTVVLLRYYQGLQPARIAARLGRSPATVRSQLSRAHEILKAVLDKHFDGGRLAWSGLVLPGDRSPLIYSVVRRFWATTTAKVACVIAAVLALSVAPHFLTGEEPITTELGAVTPEPSAPETSQGTELAPALAGVVQGADERRPVEFTPPQDDAASAKARLTICGRVVDSAGRPVSGAILSDGWSCADPGDGEQVDLDPRPLFGEGSRSGDDGRFEQEVKASSLPKRILALAPDRKQGAIATAARAGELGDLILQPLFGG